MRFCAARQADAMATILITGANRGLGFEFARQYLAEGDTVIAACRKPGAARSLQHLERDSKGALTLTELDVADATSVKRAAARVQAPAIDILINSAGLLGERGQTIGSIDYNEWMRILDVNLLGPMRVCEAFLDRVARSERRLIVTLTSGMGSLADNTSGGSIAYRTSKAAVNMAMRTAAIDLEPRGLTCIVINPGWVKTDMGGPNAKLSPEQSVGAMRRVIAKLGPHGSGRFYNYDGREFPW
jgi:NAD(P)-dependent dehydrogenase (short-subunit alcohol dehydrogenase family)